MFHRIFSAIVTVMAVSSFSAHVRASDPLSHLEPRHEHYRAIFEDLHRHPELSLKEERTSGVVAAELRRLGYEVIVNVGGFGVVGVLRNGAGKTIMARADMDGLPVQEETDLPYQSVVPGVMHACGHDFHVTSLLASAHVMQATRSEWSGTLVLVFQPAEEVVQGANAMIDDGLFLRFPKPDYGIGLHVRDSLRAGTIGYTPGTAMASSDAITAVFHGAGGHGSRPHVGRSPIFMATDYINRVIRIPAEEVDSRDAAVVNVGSIHSGNRSNIIPERAEVQLTVRSLDLNVRNYILERLDSIAKGIAEIARAPKPPEINVIQSVSMVFNPIELTERAANLFASVIGQENVKREPPIMGAEDFSEYGARGQFPTFFFFVGVTDPSHPDPLPTASHSPRFKVSALKMALETGVVTTVSMAKNLFNK